MLIQSNPNYSTQKQNFGAKLVAQEPALKKIKDHLMHTYKEMSPDEKMDYFKGETPNPQKLWEDFTEAFEAKTKNIEGTVKLIPQKRNRLVDGAIKLFNPSKAPKLEITHTANNKSYTRAIIFPGCRLIPLDHPRRQIYSLTIHDMVGHISAAIKETDPKADNPFAKLFGSMMEEFWEGKLNGKIT